MERSVDQAVSVLDLEIGLGADPLPTLGSDAQLGEQRVVAHAVAVGSNAGRLAVASEEPFEVGHRFLRVARADPRDVLHRVAEVAELEVEERGDAVPVVEEVSRAGVALHERRPGVAGVGHILTKPLEAGGQHRVGHAGRVEARLPQVELVLHGLDDRGGRDQARQIERGRVGAVEAGQPRCEVVDDLGLHTGTEPREGGVAGRTLEQHGFELGVDAEHRRARQADRVHGAVDLGFTAERVMLRLAGVDGVGAQEPLRGTVGYHVPGLVAAATGTPFERDRWFAHEVGGPASEGVLAVVDCVGHRAQNLMVSMSGSQEMPAKVQLHP